MKITLLSTYAGPDGNYAADSIVDFPEAKALVLIDAGFATAVDPVPVKQTPKPVETAAKKEQPVETAEKPQPKKVK